MATLNGRITGTDTSGSRSSLFVKKGIYYSIGYDQGEIPLSLDGRELMFAVGTLDPRGKLVNIYRWGTWRLLDKHGELIGRVTDYFHGERVKEGIPEMQNLILLERVTAYGRVNGFIRDTLRGIRTLESYAGWDEVIKVRTSTPQTDLLGRTWGDWIDGGGTSPVHTPSLRPRRYPDTHIPRRRDS